MGRDLIDGPPGRDMIADRPHGEDRHTNIRQTDRPAIDLIASSGQGILEEQVVQIFRMHPVGHPGCIRVPGHKIGHLLALAEQITAQPVRPD